MKTIIIDGYFITSISDVHKFFLTELNFPEYYGHNLNALYDCLTDVSDKTVIKVKNRDKLVYELGHYAEKLFIVLKDASEINQNIIIEF